MLRHWRARTVKGPSHCGCNLPWPARRAAPWSASGRRQHLVVHVEHSVDPARVKLCLPFRLRRSEQLPHCRPHPMHSRELTVTVQWRRGAHVCRRRVGAGGGAGSLPRQGSGIRRLGPPSPFGRPGTFAAALPLSTRRRRSPLRGRPPRPPHLLPPRRIAPAGNRPTAAVATACGPAFLGRMVLYHWPGDAACKPGASRTWF